MPRPVLRDGQVGLTWLGQSGFILRFPGARVLLDAFLSAHPDRMVPPPFAPSEASGFDVIASTHDHIDHLDREGLPAMAAASPGARIVVPAPCVEVVTGLGIARERVVGMHANGAAQLGGVAVQAIPAWHAMHPADGYSFGDGAFLGYVFSAGGVGVYHAGDTVDYEGLASAVRASGADVALLPVNGRDAAREARDLAGNLEAVEAAQLAADAGVRLAIPMHYDMFAGNLGEPERMVAEVRENHPAVSVLVLARGAEFVFSAEEA
jgi:L-ascorbate metabolism protein UlaG (beta-lactamase superfamily)